MASSFYQRYLTLIIFSLILFLPVISYGVTPQVAAGDYHTVGLKGDGSVVAVGSNYYGQCNVSGWTNIIQVAAGHGHTVGIKNDGSVVAVGYNQFDQCNVSGWMDIVQVAAGFYHTVGIKSDGSVMAVGYNDHGECDVMTVWKFRSGVISGSITDLSTGEGISGAQIFAIPPTVVSNSDGSYSLSLSPGAYDITYSKAGYQSITIPNVNIVENEEIIINIGLTPPGLLNIVTTELSSAEVGIDYNDRVRISGDIYPYT